jgi:hypothetical protein
MLDHLVNKNEDQAKEAFKSIIDNEKETFIAQDAVEPEVTESLTPADEKAVKNVVKGLKKAVSLHSKQATSLEKLLKAGKDKSLKTKNETQVDEIAPAAMALGRVAAKAAGTAVGTTATNRVMDKLGASKDKKDKKMIKKDQDKSKKK